MKTAEVRKHGRMGGLFSRVRQDHREIYHDHYKKNDVRDNILGEHHLSFPACLYGPYINNQGENSREDIKSDKSHRPVFAILDNLADTVKNAKLMARPPINVNHGILPEVAGTNTPTTNEPNIIFAPSRKNSDNAFSSSINICQNTNKEPDFVKLFMVQSVKHLPLRGTFGVSAFCTVMNA